MCQNRGAAREDGPEMHSMSFHEDRSRNDTSGSKAKTINHPMLKERERERGKEKRSDLLLFPSIRMRLTNYKCFSDYVL